MRLSPSIFAITVLAGCSQPAADTKPAAEPTRDVSLAQPAAADAPLVSALEAGKPLRTRPEIRRTAQKAGQINPTALLAIEQPLTVVATATSVAEVVAAPMPVAPAEERETLVDRGGAAQWYGVGQTITPIPSEGRRGPGVIIRGGRGGVDDDCDLHRPGVRRVPMAINQVAPPRMSFPRGGIR